MPPVTVTLNGKAAELLATLCEGGEDPSAVLVRALGLFQMAKRMKEQGGKLVYLRMDGSTAEVAF